MSINHEATSALARLIRDRNQNNAIIFQEVESYINSGADVTIRVGLANKTMPDLLLGEISRPDRRLALMYLIKAGADFSTDESRVQYTRQVGSFTLLERHPRLAVIYSDLLPLLNINNAQAVAGLIKAGADLNASMEGRVLVHRAILNNALESAKLLIEAGARLDIEDSNGLSPAAAAEKNLMEHKDAHAARRMYEYILTETYRRHPPQAKFVPAAEGEIARISPPSIAGLRISETFNFAGGTYTHVTKDLVDKTMNTTVKTFDDVGVMGVVAQAREAYFQMHQKDPPDVVRYNYKRT